MESDTKPHCTIIRIMLPEDVIQALAYEAETVSKAIEARLRQSLAEDRIYAALRRIEAKLNEAPVSDTEQGGYSVPRRVHHVTVNGVRMPSSEVGKGPSLIGISREMARD